ncbi:MAG: hypothetical protein V2J51_13080 [Erythrobacter sp.]|nr:hypothetical protein [Erythrobacter sp.]
MIEIEVQNETHQTQDRIRFAAVPRIGEGIRLREPDGIWASYDVLDVWYQKAEFGDVWMPYIHVCITPGERPGDEAVAQMRDLRGASGKAPNQQFNRHSDQSHEEAAGEFEPFKI